MTQELVQESQSSLSPQQQVFAEFLANPNDHRTYEEISKELGVDPATLWRWKKKRELQDMVWNTIIEQVKTDDLGEIWQGLLRSAKKGDTRASKLIFEVLGKYAPSPENQVNVQNNMIVQVISQVPEEK